MADCFVMPGRGEGFGIVYLEALASGVPVVASSLDASREILRDGELEVVVNPKNLQEVNAGVSKALRSEFRFVPPRLEDFSQSKFAKLLHSIPAGCTRIISRGPDKRE